MILLFCQNLALEIVSLATISAIIILNYLQLFTCQLIDKRIANCCGNVAATLAAAGNNIRNTGLHDDFLGFHNIYKAYRNADNQLRFNLAFLNQLVQTNQRSRCVAYGNNYRTFDGAGFSMQAAALVEPASLARAATSGSAMKQTAFAPSLPRPILLMPVQAMLVSVTMVAPFAVQPALSLLRRRKTAYCGHNQNQQRYG